jgi:uncharacterized protein
MTLDWTQGSLAEGLRLYEAGEFFAAHEAWESRWLESQEPEKTFLQGLIQVTAAFHHLQRKNPLGTTRLLQAALRRLEPYPAYFGGISVTLLCSDIQERLQALNSDEPD